MFVYEKKLQYPVKIATPNPKLAAVIISIICSTFFISVYADDENDNTGGGKAVDDIHTVKFLSSKICVLIAYGQVA